MTTTTTTPEAWLARNQAGLMAELARVRGRLERHAGGVAGDEDEDESAAEAAPEDSALAALCTTFELTPFERDVVLLCAGVELDAGFATLCAAAHGDPRRTQPTFGLALAALAEAHWSALVPSASLRFWRIIELGVAGAVMTSPLRIDERILHYLTGIAYIDERLSPVLVPMPRPRHVLSSAAALGRRVAQAWEANRLVQLCGADTATSRAVAAYACTLLDAPLFALAAADVPATASERDGLVRLWNREARLGGAALLLEVDDTDSADTLRAAAALADRLDGPVALGTREPLHVRRGGLRLDVERPTQAEQRALWLHILGERAASANGEIEAAVGQFRMGLEGIESTAADLESTIAAGDVDPGTALWDACRYQARMRMDELAERIEPAAAWDDLVLPAAQKQVLRQIGATVRQRTRVYDGWGFGARGGRGLGISALFAGASGTGKTMAAEVLAAELRLDLYRIDLSQVVSKYIGETEKNLRRVFDAADASGAILLFDEADALFGKRSEVKDSHDRYANIEVSYLLQRMEAYHGLAILTTNMRNALDPAFLRRLRFVVQFPFPDAEQRAEIWRRIFPSQAPTRDLDAVRLARLNVPGGNIRNIALTAAFLAAESDQPVGMAHLLLAARGEYAKLERPLTDAEVAGWA